MNIVTVLKCEGDIGGITSSSQDRNYYNDIDFMDNKILPKYKSLFGRLVVKLKKRNTYSRFTFNLKKFVDDAVVLEILPHIYNGYLLPN